MLRRYTTVSDFYDRLAEAHQNQADDPREHEGTRGGAQARAEYYRELADHARTHEHTGGEQ
ncbi:hypothetical protein ABZ639_27045 [Saccharomonospora sp. NPDC006951]